MSADKHPANSPSREASRAVSRKMRDLRKEWADNRSAEGLSRRPIYSRGTLWHDEADAQLRRIPALEVERDKLRASLAASEASDAESIRMYRAARDERDQLRAEVEALRADAERYRWLKSVPSGFEAQRIVNDTPHGMDASIDKARKQQ